MSRNESELLDGSYREVDNAAAVQEQKNWELIKAFFEGETIDLNPQEAPKKPAKKASRRGWKVLNLRKSQKKNTAHQMSVDTIAKQTPQQTEEIHNFIQFAFPTITRSRYNPSAPLLTENTKTDFKQLMHPELAGQNISVTRYSSDRDTIPEAAQPLIRLKLLRDKLLTHWGYVWAEDAEPNLTLTFFEQEPSPKISLLYQDQQDNHNYKRMARYLESMSLAGYPQWAAALIDALFEKRLWERLPASTHGNFLEKIVQVYHQDNSPPDAYLKNEHAKLAAQTYRKDTENFYDSPAEVTSLPPGDPAAASTPTKTPPQDSAITSFSDFGREAIAEAEALESQRQSTNNSTPLPDETEAELQAEFSGTQPSSSKFGLFKNPGAAIKSGAQNSWNDFKALPPAAIALVVIGVLVCVAALITMFTVPGLTVPISLGVVGALSILIANLFQPKPNK